MKGTSCAEITLYTDKILNWKENILYAYTKLPGLYEICLVNRFNAQNKFRILLQKNIYK